MDLYVYTDGSSKNNGKKNMIGGWAYLVLDGYGNMVDERYGAVKDATNNQMELMAIMEFLKAVNTSKFSSIKIFTDSAYIANCFKDKWYKKWERNNWITSSHTPVKNKEMWEWLIPYFELNKFTIEKVRGHADDTYNNHVDDLAQGAADNCEKIKTFNIYWEENYASSSNTLF